MEWCPATLSSALPPTRMLARMHLAQAPKTMKMEIAYRPNLITLESWTSRISVLNDDLRAELARGSSTVRKGRSQFSQHQNIVRGLVPRVDLQYRVFARRPGVPGAAAGLCDFCVMLG